MKKILSSFCVVLFSLILLISCGCKHEWKDATCTEPQTCTKCGKTQGEALGHMYGKEKVLKEPTCTETGSKELTCSICGEVETVEIPANGHKWKLVNQEKAPTCTEKGKENYRCSICSATKNEELAKLSHQYRDGYCKVCFAEDPSGVSFNPSSDEKKQIEKVQKIADREVKKESNFYYLFFSFLDGDLNTVIAPCVLDIKIVNSDGETVYKAKRVVETDDYSKWSNAFREWVLASPKIMRSDIKEGSSSYGTLYFTVKLIDTYFEETALSIGNLPMHSFGKKVIVKEVTCGTDGLARRTCSSCGEIVEETIPASGNHSYRVEGVKEKATCISEGAMEYKCTVCGEKKVEKIKELGHSYGEGRIAVESTCTTEGEREYTCTRCGEKKVENLQKILHSYNEGEITVAPTCVSEGEREYTCTVCGEIKVEKIEKVAHSFGDEEVVEPTCAVDGVVRRTCSSCGLQIVEGKIPATNRHTYRGGTVAKEPTCTVEGVMEFRCIVCGKLGRTEELDRLEHAFVNDKCENCGTLRIGSKGPAGGFVFYDCDLDNDEGNDDGLISSECGWRFLEAAPEDIGKMVFGYYRYSSNGENLYVNGDRDYYKENCTREEIGFGKSNTEMLIDAIGDEAYVDSSGTEKTARYASKACADYQYNGYDDWFLPSIEELELMYNNLHFENNERPYWSSSEDHVKNAWGRGFYNGNFRYRGSRYNNYYVRPIRAF